MKKQPAKEGRERDRQAAEDAADLALMLGVIREDQRSAYIRGWLNRGFYE